MLRLLRRLRRLHLRWLRLHLRLVGLRLVGLRRLEDLLRRANFLHYIFGVHIHHSLCRLGGESATGSRFGM